MAYGSVNVPGAVATPEHGGSMSADDKRALETLKGLIPFTLMERTATGNPATFVDGTAGDVRNLTVTLTPIQSGSGDASPTNVRPITGVSSVTVTRTGTGGANAQTVTVSLVDSNNNPLTVYGGTLDVTAGTLTVTHVCLDLGSVTMTRTTGRNDTRAFFYPISDMPLTQNNRATVMVSHFRFVAPYSSDNANLVTALPSNCATLKTVSRNFYINPDSSIDTAADFQAWARSNNLHVIYPLEFPIAYNLTPAQLAALSGYNAVSADSGSVVVTYRADPALAYEELYNAILSLGAGI